MPGKTILILGGGIGGQVAANRLRQLLGENIALSWWTGSGPLPLARPCSG
jgi:hypothetical protein